MGGTVIDDPENPASLVVGWPCHYLFDQAVKGIDAIFGLAAAKNPGMMDVESGKVGPCSTAKILMLDAHASTRPASVSGVFAAARLNAGFFVRGNDKLSSFSGLPSHSRAYRSNRRRKARRVRGNQRNPLFQQSGD